jgi:hypothetical protein
LARQCDVAIDELVEDTWTLQAPLAKPTPQPGEADGMTGTTLPPWQAARLAILLDALSGVPISHAEHRFLVWLAGFEARRRNDASGGGRQDR